MAYTEELHPRGAVGSSTGGQFVAKGAASSSSKKTAGGKKQGPPPGSMAYDPKRNRGTGYGMRGGDKRVRALQTILNRLGMKDSHGRPLAVDGKLGPKTTSSIKRLQRRLGLKADGIVTPAFLAQIRNLKAVPRAKAKPRTAKATRVTQADDPDEDEDGDLDLATEALVWALAGDEGVREAVGGADFNSKHPRGPDGKFLTIGTRIKNAIAAHRAGNSDGHPLDEFSREQLRKAAKALGVDLKRGEDRDSIAEKLLKHKAKAAASAVPDAKPAAPKAAAGKHAAVIGKALGDIDNSSATGWRADASARVRANEALDKLAVAYKDDPERLALVDAALEDVSWASRSQVLERLALLDEQLSSPDGVGKPDVVPEVAAVGTGVGDIVGNLPRTVADFRTETDKREAALRAVLEGEYGGLNVALSRVAFGNEQTMVLGKIVNKDGTQVGVVRRTFKNAGDGGLAVSHDLLVLDPSVQGSGFAREFNGHLFDWYRQSGVDRVEVHANIDVGGYTWATQGFDFDSDGAARNWLRIAYSRLEDLNGSVPSSALRELRRDMPELTDAEVDVEIRKLRALLDRMHSGDPVSTFEISQLGRQPGQGRNDMWIGKWIMLGSDWMGVLRL